MRGQRHERRPCVICGSVDETSFGDRNQRYCHDCRPFVVKVQHRVGCEVAKAIRAGKLQRATNYHCADCGKKASTWDHRSYEHVLDVQAVCRKCNFARGPAVYPPNLDLIEQKSA